MLPLSTMTTNKIPKMATTYRRYLFGIVVSLLSAGWLGALGLTAAIRPGAGWDGLIFILAALWIGGPLVIVLAIAWLYYLVRDKGRVPGPVHALLLLPTVVSMLIYPVSLSIDQAKYARFRSAHPAIEETHVNLSGRELWLDTTPSADPGATQRMAGDSPTRFNTFTRYPNPESIASGQFPYAGARLKQDITQYHYWNPFDNVTVSLPMHRLSSPALDKRGTSRLRYMYFHYPDHAEVVPAVMKHAATTAESLSREERTGLVMFNTQNYTATTIVRLEVNGQTMDLGGYAHMPILPGPGACPGPPTPAGGAYVDIDQPFLVRWQTLEMPSHWQTASVRVPPFRQPHAMAGRSSLLSAQLYFLPDGVVDAERYVEVRARGSLRGIRATGLPAHAANWAICGGVHNSKFNPDTVKLLSD